jgi:hypothetical protein
MTSRLCTPLAAVLLSGFLIGSFVASAGKSTTSDEPSHIASGLSYVSTGEFVANLQHPPLLKELSGVSLLAGGIRWPNSDQAVQLIERRAAGLEWGIGNAIITDGGPAHVMAWARLPFPLLATLLGAVIYVWGRKLLGEPAALGAVVLYVLDPTIAAHSYLVTTDVGFAAFALLFLFALWTYLERPERTRAICAGLAMGAMLGAKFSAVALLPVAVLLVVAAVVWPIEGGGAAPAYAGASERSDRKASRATKRDRPDDSMRPRRAQRYAVDLLLMGLVAAAVVDLLYLFSGGLYFTGLGLVNADHQPGYLMFMAGQLAESFTTYFAVAYLLKEPLPSIGLALVGFVLLWRTRRLTILHRLFLVAPPVVLFIGYTAGAADLGIRYIIPILPFAFLLGGLALATLMHSPGLWRRGVAAALSAWLVMAAVGIWPDGMSYFNELACFDTPARIGLDGGSQCGTRWLDDSNVDWGQGLMQLKTWLAQHAAGRAVHVSTFGGFPPQAYGIVGDSFQADDIASRPSTGLYVMTAHFVARLPATGDAKGNGAWAWLRETAPSAVVGHAMYVYDFGDGHAATASSPKR